MPAPSDNTITVERAALLAAIRRLAAVSDDVKSSAVGLIWDSARLSLRLTREPELGDEELEPIAASGTGRVAASARYLIEQLEALDGQTVVIDHGAPSAPISHHAAGRTLNDNDTHANGMARTRGREPRRAAAASGAWAPARQRTLSMFKYDRRRRHTNPQRRNETLQMKGTIMNDLTKYSGSDDDGFEATASETVGAITGQMLKFVKGHFYIGKGREEELPIGTELVTLSTAVGWQKWQDGRRVDSRFRAAGERLPTREQLDDADLIDSDNDPWQLTRFLYLLEPKTASDFTFVTSSWGGHDAIRTLSRQIAIRRANGSGANAVVRLGVGSKHSKEYGAIQAPKFQVVGWTGETAKPVPVRPKMDDGFSDELPAPKDMADEIPF